MRFGYPNEEALEGHRLYRRGLRRYSGFEVCNSSWIDAMEKQNQVHHLHNKQLYSGLRHFIFTFHDSTLEFTSDEAPRSKVRTGLIRPLVAEEFAGLDTQR